MGCGKVDTNTIVSTTQLGVKNAASDKSTRVLPTAIAKMEQVEVKPVVEMTEERKDESPEVSKKEEVIVK